MTTTPLTNAQLEEIVAVNNDVLTVREAFDVVQEHLAKANSMAYAIKFYVANVADFVGQAFQPDETTEEILGHLAGVLHAFDFDINETLELSQWEAVFNCNEADQNDLAMNLVRCLIADLEENDWPTDHAKAALAKLPLIF